MIDCTPDTLCVFSGIACIPFWNEPQIEIVTLYEKEDFNFIKEPV
jgi:hypothetical protein